MSICNFMELFTALGLGAVMILATVWLIFKCGGKGD